jgi:signal transduction histidine kinase
MRSGPRLGSVRVRTTLAAAVITGAAVTLAGWVLVRSVEDEQVGVLREDASQVLDEVAGRLNAGEHPGDVVESVDLETGIVEIRYPDGRVYSAAATGGASVVLGPEGDGFVGRGPDPGGDADGEPGDWESGSPIGRSVDTPAGVADVSVAVPSEQVARTTNAVGRALVVGLPVVVSLAALAAWALVGRALRPVETIRSEATAIGASTLHRRVPEPPSRDEIGRLAHTMNAMLDRLDRSARRQREFVADASHELRSPLAGIRTDVEVALHEGDRADWPRVARGVLAAEARLEALLKDLLLLAAGDEEAPVAAATPVDVAELVADEARRPRRVPVTVEYGSDHGDDGQWVDVAGSRPELQRALANLLDNAARHADGTVRVGTAAGERTVRLWVDDDGPGIPAADRERVFERFTRLDDGRARDDGGAGLGLAVVRSIVTRHRGSVTAGTGPLGGARFLVALPRRPPGTGAGSRGDY